MERLQKILAGAGVASRRKSEEIIKSGRVRVNGQVVTELGTKADAYKDKIEVDGKRIQQPRAHTYVLLNKPTGTVTTAKDEYDRKTVIDLLKGVEARVYPVGRLDLDAEGVLLLTNDGEMAAALTHPSSQIPKTYLAKVKGLIDKEACARVETGVVLEDGFAKATNVHKRIIGRNRAEKNSWVELTVTEGRNHLVKRLLDSVGHPVIRLVRVEFAGLKCRDVKPGTFRHLKRDELKKLKAVARAGKSKRNQTPSESFDDWYADES